jgi:hypothetical protein
MKKIKPILVVRFPAETYSHVDNEEFEKTFKALINHFENDYYVLSVKDTVFSVGDIKFELYNSKDVTEIEFKQLQERILETIK